MNARYRYPLYLFYEGKISSQEPMTCRICHREIEKHKVRIHVASEHLGLLQIYVVDGKVKKVETKSDNGTWGNIMLGRLRAERGNKCFDCGNTSILPEFHHIKPTGLNGRGRGSSQRAKDIRDHPDAYVLLCKSCHKARHRAQLIEKLELKPMESRSYKHDNGY